jgi:hypothetical protein
MFLGMAQLRALRSGSSGRLVMVEGGGVAIRQQEELAGQNNELGRPALGDQQNLVEVERHGRSYGQGSHRGFASNTARDPRDRRAPFSTAWDTSSAASWTPDKDNPVPSRIGGNPNRSDSWFSEDDVRMPMPWPPCKLYSQNLALQAEMDIFRVREMRSRPRKGRKVFEYLVDAFGLDARTWITEDQLRISPSPMLVAKLKGTALFWKS